MKKTEGKTRRTEFGTVIHYDAGNRPIVPADESLASCVLTRIRGVMNHDHDKLVLSGAYERDRQLCLDRLKAAQVKLDSAGESGKKSDRELELGWAWHEVEIELQTLASVEARMRLARRRVALDLL